ncbi:MAG: transglycosylase SLT domain-containing protein [Hydrogenophaga sp.]
MTLIHTLLRPVGAMALLLLLSACATTSAPRPARTSEPVASTPAPSTSQRAATPQGTKAAGKADPTLSTIAPGSVSQPPVIFLSAPADIWERIRRGFAMPDLDSELVRDREQWYATRPDYLQRMTARSERYLFHIVEEIERRNMPMELALLPFIESAFNPQAVSSARAAGMWQFMPATGQSFDLKQNVFRDDRRDVLASTRAALDYLQQLYERFGDWHLALAAYNWGQGNVGRAISRNQKAGLPSGYPDLSMPQETRYYVPKLQAVKNIVARPEAFGAQLPAIGNRPFFDTITLTRDVDVALIARLAGISEKDFRALNPSIKQPVVMASGTPNILLPWDIAADFQRRLDAHNGPLASWTAWIVPQTMGIAEAARRAGMSESQLREVNNIPPRMLVRAGSSLLVPRSQHRDADVPEHVADNGQLSLQPEVVLRRTVVRARKGENLAKLASRYGVSAVSAAGWNKLSVNAPLKPGQRVTLMLPQRTPKVRAVARKSPAGASKPTATAQRKAVGPVAAKRTPAAPGGKAGTKVALREKELRKR